jgi:hypothetical protein
MAGRTERSWCERAAYGPERETQLDAGALAGAVAAALVLVWAAAAGRLGVYGLAVLAVAVAPIAFGFWYSSARGSTRL